MEKAFILLISAVLLYLLSSIGNVVVFPTASETGLFQVDRRRAADAIPLFRLSASYGLSFQLQTQFSSG